ncbi:glycerophosphoryl diester phosphodiesterase [Oceanihabitans sediminis]|uniref:Glycerophosphodiester phosphodiesterase n=1 Tax=Oceanihabitans sediminis TaxID=1812012 RepID=A0A368P232_9FLAO|nr:glycerophosphodiester phosphodiesterase family protein [Oceanihabitans sediminis]MDX1774739.1 glycerophosphodiester phosphodiesterase family protein [Oceanihabitans sediminis]RBP27644.1 glycerophosphoryl diester phosphodiesterase [Oceanihabitans sediminis]RCU56466.1 glycerophosphodiester phosphodiesterase [Oceanihabitans sediminis]
MSEKIDVQGHRGCRGLMPENTIPGFLKAIEIGVDTLELDIAISKDHKVIVTHEPFMSRKICLDPNGNEIPKEDDKKYNLYEMTYEEIKAFDCGTKIHKKFPKQKKLKAYKPSLDEVIEACDAVNKNIKYNIEIKAKRKFDGIYTPGPKVFVELVLQTLKKHSVLHRCNLQSFDIRVLEEIKIQEPKTRMAILINTDEKISKKLNKLSFKPEIIGPYYKLLDKETTRKFQKQGFKVIPWTVNIADEMREMIHCNVNGIITDFPDVLLEVLQKK